jgi:isoquinoline 1-oxidoreductase subunit beta
MKEQGVQSVGNNLISRRHLLLSAGALLVTANLSGKQLWAASQTPTGATINAYVAIAPDGRITIQSAHSEIGQGIVTTWCAIIADEMEADWNKVRFEFSPVAAPYQHPIYKWQFTGNSESIRSYHDMIRKMGAAARTMLVQAAANQFGVPVAELQARNSQVTHAKTGRSLTYAQLATAAATVKLMGDPVVKPRSDWRLVGAGRSLPRLDVPPKVTGEAVFGMDVIVPGMVHAAVASADTIGGAILKMDDHRAKTMPGVIAVIPLQNAVAVVAQHYWQARLALAALDITWQPGAAAGLDDAALAALYAGAYQSQTNWVVAEQEADAVSAIAASPRRVSAQYVSPWLSHAPMEPMNATVEVRADGVTAWVPTQGSQMTQVVLSSVLGFKPEQITIHRTYIGGGFGRKLLADVTAQAAICAKAVGKPVKLIWHREEDIKQDIFRPAFDCQLTASLDAGGMPTALHAKLVAPTILAPVSPTPIKPGMVDNLCVEGLVESPYDWGAVRIDYHMLSVPIPTMVLRTTGHGPNNFAMESFIDELAAQANMDPLDYRRRLLAKNQTGLAVLNRAAQLANWGQQPKGRHLGIAFADGFGAFLAQVVELSVTPAGVKIHRIVSVADAGVILDRVNATSMIEGGVIWGLSAALYSEVTFKNGHTQERNYDRYRVVTLPDTPELITDFVEGRDKMGGLAEVGPVCIPAAFNNAIFAATGQRYRRLPMTRNSIHTLYGAQYV